MPNPFDQTGSEGGVGAGAKPTGVSPFSLTRLFGAPTYQEAGASAQGSLFQALTQDYQQNGGSPQRAIINVLKTPHGAQFMRDMAMGGAGIDDLKKWVDTVTPQTKTLTPGEMMTDPSGKVLAQNPTAQLQTLQGLTAAAQSDNPTVSEMARAALYGEKGAQAAAWNKLAQMGVVTPEVAAKGQAGAFKEVTMTSPSGEPVGKALIDITTGQAIWQQGNQQGQTPATTGTPGVTQPVQPSPDAAKVLGDPRESMALGFGINAWSRNTIGSLARNVDQTFDDPASEMAQKRRNAEAQLATAVTAHPDAQGRLKIQVQKMLDLLPSKFASDPVKAVDGLIQLRDFAEQSLAQDQATIREGTTAHSKQIIQEAERSAQAWQRILQYTPSRAGLQVQKDALKAGTAGAESPGSVVGAAVKAVTTTVPGAIGGVLDAAGVGKPTSQQPSAVPAQEGGLIQQIKGMTLQDLAKIDRAKVSDAVKQAMLARARELTKTGAQ